MIAFLQGTLVSKLADRVEMDVHGVGYEVLVSKRTLQDLPPTGRALLLKTYLHVREDIQQLYGFLKDSERQAFLLLLSVSGIGPKVALGVLSALTPEELYRAVLQNDLQALRSVPGVGAKTAQHVVFEIKDKVARIAGSEGEGGIPLPASSRTVSDVLLALTALGYSETEARRAVGTAVQALGEKTTVEELLKVSLKSMNG